MHTLRAVTALSIILVVMFAGYLRSYETRAYLPALSLAKQKAIIDRTIKDSSPESAWQFLKSQYLASGEVRVSGAPAHQLAHKVGDALFRYRGEKGIDECDATFTNGCYHGFVEAMINVEGAAAMAHMRDICIATRVEGECIHGVGHGIGASVGSDLTRALHFCESSFGDFAFPCWEGVFMQHVGYMADARDPRAFTWYPCDAIPSKYRAQCASSKPLFFGEILHRPVVEIARFCATAESNDMRQSCIRSLGFNIVRAESGNEEKIKHDCASTDLLDRTACITAAAHLVASGRYPDWRAVAPKLCESLISPESEKCQALLAQFF